MANDSLPDEMNQ